MRSIQKRYNLLALVCTGLGWMNLQARDTEPQVEAVFQLPLAPAGITLDSKNNIYISDLASKAIGMLAANTKQYRILASDPRFLWPDGLCFGADGRLYFFSNTRNARPRGLKSALEPPSNFLFRLQTPASGRVGD